MKSLNDQVEEITLLLIDDPKFRSYINAVNDADSVEGSLLADNTLAAVMIRNKAVEIGVDLTSVKATNIVKALNVALRRHGLSRQQRYTSCLNGCMSRRLLKDSAPNSTHRRAHT